MLIYFAAIRWRKIITLDRRLGQPETLYKPQLTSTLEFVSAPVLYVNRTTARASSYSRKGQLTICVIAYNRATATATSSFRNKLSSSLVKCSFDIKKRKRRLERSLHVIPMVQ
jgi:hypothetical protein